MTRLYKSTILNEQFIKVCGCHLYIVNQNPASQTSAQDSLTGGIEKNMSNITRYMVKDSKHTEI